MTCALLEVGFVALRRRGILIGSLAIVAGACSDHGSTPAPVGVDPRTCNYVKNNLWYSQLTETFDQTRHCPYTVVNLGDQLPFNLDVRNTNASDPNSLTVPSLGYVIKSKGGAVLRSGYEFWQITPTYGIRQASISDTYPGGYEGNFVVEDAATMTAGYSGNTATLTIKLPGRYESYPPVISGSSYVVSDYPQSWSADVSAEPISYRYQWYLNGAAVPGETGIYFTTTLFAGQHEIKLQARRSDESIAWSILNVNAVNCGGPDIC